MVSYDRWGNATSPAIPYLFLDAYVLRQSSAGIYSLLPLGQRVIDKLSKIIEDEMYAVGSLRFTKYHAEYHLTLCIAGASKVTLPHLLQPDLWEKSGRWESSGPEVSPLATKQMVATC